MELMNAVISAYPSAYLVNDQKKSGTFSYRLANQSLAGWLDSAILCSVFFIAYMMLSTSCIGFPMNYRGIGRLRS